MIAILQRAGANKYLPMVLFLILALLLSLAWTFYESEKKYFLDRASRIAFLVDEMTTTLARQQRALDEIGMDEDGAFIYLIKYLDDERSLADKDVMFLNTHPKAFEKYFHTGGSRVGETILRYLCWKTMECDAGFDFNDAHSVVAQKEKIKKYCREKFIGPKFYKN